MTWHAGVPLLDLAQRLIDVRLRVERIRLARRIQSLESRVSSHGINPKELREVRKSLQQRTYLAPDRIDRELVLPRKPAGIIRRRYLTVKSKPGSVF
jgi:hypothetical protein